MPARLISGNINNLDPVELETILRQAGITQLDTAARYANGESERIIGSSNFAKSILIDTKINIGATGDNSLTPELIEKSLSNSLKVLGVDKVNILYCHAPDAVTPVAVQAKAFDEQYRQGRFRYLGVSNFAPSMVEEWLAISERDGYVKPTVYQGQYNLLCRGYEDDLFPLLRKHNMVFNAFSPLAGGFLMGKYTSDGFQAGSRFDKAPNYRAWYDKPSMHEAVKCFKSIAEEEKVGMDELAVRWVVHHSILGEQDGVILGARKISHLETNVEQVGKGPLRNNVVERLDELWQGVKHEADQTHH